LAALSIQPYAGALQGGWDSFVKGSKNGLFLFERGYMDYHADRFKDQSLLIRRGGRIVAVLPANRVGDTLQSHGGLTFGGLVVDRSMTTPLMMEIFDALGAHLAEAGVTTLLYKRSPHVFHSVPAEEDLYALFRHGATLVRRDLSSTIDTRERIPPDKDRRYSISKGKASAVKVAPSSDYRAFMRIEADLLREKYAKEPTHSADEMALLAGRFPENIKLFAADLDGAMVGGVIIYESANVAHTQYIGSTKEGRKLNAVDLLLHHLIENEYQHKRYFDFGISTEKAGRYLNTGLVDFKESFGATAVAYDTFELKLAM